MRVNLPERNAHTCRLCYPRAKTRKRRLFYGFSVRESTKNANCFNILRRCKNANEIKHLEASNKDNQWVFIQKECGPRWKASGERGG
jgi:hypothetical protein